MIKKFPYPYIEVYVKSLEATRNLDFDIVKENIDNGIIEFKVGVSIWSFGEKFKLTITKDTTPVTIEVTSEGSVGLQLFDWNKNKNNIENFFKELNRLLRK